MREPTPRPSKLSVAIPVLDLARWAPSGDNAQPWRFELADEHSVVIHGRDTSDRCIYDLDGRATQIALGGLVETARIAASGLGLATQVKRIEESGPVLTRISLAFNREPSVSPDPLLPFIRIRCTQRRAMPTLPLDPLVKTDIESSVGSEYEVAWFEGWRMRLRFARLMWRNGKLRLSLPEAYTTHRDVIEWGAAESQDRIPERSMGIDPVTAKLMRWALGSWKRVEFLNTYLAGSIVPRAELDLIPSLACAAHFAIIARQPLATLEQYIAGGRAMQRLWLSAAKHGLQIQPEMTPLIFARYVREGRRFTKSEKLFAAATRLSVVLSQLLQPRSEDRLVFLGRIGKAVRTPSRSIRLPIEKLMV